MEKEVIIRAESDETMVAVIEDHRLVELYLDRDDEERLTGNIYKGVVENVLPGMQAAFVDIGLAKNSFLYIREVLPKTGLEEEKLPSDADITKILKRNQEVLVQIVKEPTPSKGARVTTHLTLAGRYLVLMPTMEYVGISRRIEETAERERLGAIAEHLRPKGMGLIVRTVAQGAGEEELASDLKWLKTVWGRIMNKSSHSKGRSLIYKDLNLLSSIIRDQVDDNVNRIIVNSEEAYEMVMECLTYFPGEFKKRVIISDMLRVFEEYNLPDEIRKVGRRKSWLKSGGYIVIDMAEALTVIDVNTGKFVGSTCLEDTVVRTNLEAVGEIARQLRLRNIGGIVVIDFIDMDNAADQLKVIEALTAELKKDRVKTNVLGMTKLGLLEMTRKKTGHGITQMMDRECPHCEGRGRIFNFSLHCLKIRHEVNKLAKSTVSSTICLKAPSELAQYIRSNKLLPKWEKECRKRLLLIEDNSTEEATLRPE